MWIHQTWRFGTVESLCVNRISSLKIMHMKSTKQKQTKTSMHTANKRNWPYALRPTTMEFKQGTFMHVAQTAVKKTPPLTDAWALLSFNDQIGSVEIYKKLTWHSANTPDSWALLLKHWLQALTTAHNRCCEGGEAIFHSDHLPTFQHTL